MRWSSVDSLMPQVLSTRETIRLRIPRLSRIRGITCSSSIGFISDGTPGMQTKIRPSLRMSRPGAVPRGLWSTSAPSGTMACLRLFSAIVTRRWANRSSM